MGHMRRPSRAQALVEMALVVPVLAWLMLGAVDLGRAFYLSIEVAGASRAGMRSGILDQATDIGNSVRSEPNSAIPNNPATWGLTGPGGTNANCTGAAQTCGDSLGCPSTAFVAGQLACFAVRDCTLTAVGSISTCTATWNTRPTPSSDHAVDVRVVYKLAPVTPFIGTFASPDGFFYLTIDSLGLELY